MNTKLSRRAFLAQTAGYAALASGLDLVPGRSHAADEPDWPKVADLPLTVIKGKPHERGRQYGEHFADAIANFLEKEIVKPFSASVKRDDMLRYAAQCSKLIKDYSPEIFDELDGMAEGAKLKLEEVVAVTLHEEFYHQGKLPKADHCTAIAAGPPDTDDKNTYVGQKHLRWPNLGLVHEPVRRVANALVATNRRAESPSVFLPGAMGRRRDEFRRPRLLLD